MADVAIGRRLPGLGPVIGGQVRYQLTLLLRNPRTLMAGLILPGAVLALQLGRVEHLDQRTAAALLAARVAGLVVLGAMSVAYLSLSRCGSSQWDPYRPRHARFTGASAGTVRHKSWARPGS